MTDSCCQQIKDRKTENTKRQVSHESCLADMKTGSSEKNLKIVEWVKHVQAPIIWACSPLRISNGRPRELHPGRNLVVTFMNSSKGKGVCRTKTFDTFL